MDLYCEWNGDLVLAPNGGLQVATGWTRIRQRIIRSLITTASVVLPDGSNSPAGYPLHPKYGVGLGVMVSQTLTSGELSTLKQDIVNAVTSDVSVDPTAEPQVLFRQPQQNVLEVYVTVALITGEVQTLGVSVE